MTLAISMLKNIFLLHTRTQDYHLMYPNVDIFSLKKFTYVEK